VEAGTRATDHREKTHNAVSRSSWPPKTRTREGRSNADRELADEQMLRCRVNHAWHEGQAWLEGAQHLRWLHHVLVVGRGRKKRLYGSRSWGFSPWSSAFPESFFGSGLRDKALTATRTGARPAGAPFPACDQKRQAAGRVGKRHRYAPPKIGLDEPQRLATGSGLSIWMISLLRASSRGAPCCGPRAKGPARGACRGSDDRSHHVRGGVPPLCRSQLHGRP